ncbi:3-bisphosphoglycerate-dependent phosphoglyceratemutase 1 [Striga asiatica]|uniref:3-bisphosphoglycerate-dependent phosphoglyceratemutase 1 n=1 Tax=Striga asiatica TaxID=4170 RepID=A0A5A7PAU9_STRAF|nr:3-bisphosphoglycerate-dependent phosphoglyceratemutase 1 [Striga asiatica]
MVMIMAKKKLQRADKGAEIEGLKERRERKGGVEREREGTLGPIVKYCLASRNIQVKNSLESLKHLTSSARVDNALENELPGVMTGKRLDSSHELVPRLDELGLQVGVLGSLGLKLQGQTSDIPLSVVDQSPQSDVGSLKIFNLFFQLGDIIRVAIQSLMKDGV